MLIIIFRKYQFSCWFHAIIYFVVFLLHTLKADLWKHHLTWNWSMAQNRLVTTKLAHLNHIDFFWLCLWKESESFKSRIETRNWNWNHNSSNVNDVQPYQDVGKSGTGSVWFIPPWCRFLKPKITGEQKNTGTHDEWAGWVHQEWLPTRQSGFCLCWFLSQVHSLNPPRGSKRAQRCWFYHWSISSSTTVRSKWQFEQTRKKLIF